MDFSKWTPGAFFFSCRDSSKGLLTSFECLVFLLYLWASINRIQVFRLRYCSHARRCLHVTSFVHLLFDDWRQSSALSCYDQYPLNQYQVILKKWGGGGVSKPIRNGEIFWLNRVELQWGWVVILLCHADWEWYIPVLRESSARDYATSWHKWWLSERTVNKNSHWLEVIKTSVKCLLLTPCLMIIAVIS